MVKKTKNIMYFSSTSSLTSGASHSLLKLASLVKRAGHNVVVILNEHGDLEEKLKEENINYHVIKQCNWNVWIKNCIDKKDTLYYIKYLPRQLINGIAIWKLKRLVNLYQTDIIHVNTLTSFIGGKLATHFSHIKLVWQAREFMEEDLGIEFCNPQKSQQLLSQSDMFVSISQAIEDKFGDVFSLKQTKVIHNGISIDNYLIDRIPFQNPEIRILSSGRIMPGKGQKDLLLALAYLPDKYRKQFTCHVIGHVEDDDYMKQLQDIVNTHHLDGVVFHGFQDNPEYFFESSDILCVCSKQEAFGRITVEGMLANLLVIGTNSGGTKEIVSHGQTGYLYESGNAKELSKLLIYVLEHKKKVKTIARRGQEEAINKFSDKANAEKIISLYYLITEGRES